MEQVNSNSNRLKEQLTQYTYYIIIAVISILSLVFLPMLGSTVGLEWNYPNTWAGKLVFWVTKGLVALVNVLLFYSFRQQAKVNVQDNPLYQAAYKMLLNDAAKRAPRSPKRYLSRSYLTKGGSIAIGSVVSTLALTQAILTFDYVSLFTYLFTIVMGVVFGVLQMKSDEIYWTTEYYEYALASTTVNAAGGEKTNGI